MEPFVARKTRLLLAEFERRVNLCALREMPREVIDETARLFQADIIEAIRMDAERYRGVVR